jgi:hypothetical protein
MIHRSSIVAAAYVMLPLSFMRASVAPASVSQGLGIRIFVCAALLSCPVVCLHPNPRYIYIHEEARDLLHSFQYQPGLQMRPLYPPHHHGDGTIDGAMCKRRPKCRPSSTCLRPPAHRVPQPRAVCRLLLGGKRKRAGG